MAFLALALAVLAAHGPALTGGFLAFDDDRIVTENPLFAAPAGEALAGILTRPIADAWLPVAHLSLWLDWTLSGGKAWALHLASLFWHLLACLALFALLLRLGLPWAGALGPVLLFAVHPALVEDVAWISSRKCLLAGFFSFLSLTWWVGSLQGGRRAGWAALAAALAAVLAHPGALVLLPWILLLTLLVPRPGGRSLPVAPLVALVLVLAGTAALHLVVAAGAGTTAGEPRPVLLLVGTPAWYLQRFLLPLGLSVDYPYPLYLERLAGGALHQWLLAAAPLLAAALVWLRRRTFRRPQVPLAVTLGLLFFTLGLLPYNNLLPASAVLLADRYLYLPAAGLVLALAGMAAGPGRFARALRVAVGAAVLAGVLLAFPRSADFRDTENLWRATLAVEPRSAVAHFNLATHLLARGRGLEGKEGKVVGHHLDRALAEATRPQLRARILAQRSAWHARRGEAASAAAELVRARQVLLRLPAGKGRDRAWADYGLRLARRLEEADRGEEARRVVAEIREKLPDYVQAELHLLQNRLLRVERLLRRGKKEEAERLARELEPAVAALAREERVRYGALILQGRLAATRLGGGTFLAALKHFGRARRVDPRRPESYIEIANIYMNQDEPDLEGALAELATGLEVLPENPDLLSRKGYLLFQLGRRLEGVEWFDRARRAAPSRRDLVELQVQALCRTIETMLGPGQGRDPRRWLDRALALAPRHPRVLHVQGLWLAARDRLGDAVKCLERARALRPGDDAIRLALARTRKQFGFMLLTRDRQRALAELRAVLDLFLPPEREEVATILTLLDPVLRRHLREYAVCRKLKDREGAGQALARALALAPSRWLPYARLYLELEEAALAGERGGPVAAAARRQELVARARRALARAGLAAPAEAKEAEAWFKVACFQLMGEGRSHRAYWLSLLLERLFPGRPLWTFLRAKVHLGRGDLEAARRLLEGGVESWPDHRPLRRELGLLLCGFGRRRWEEEKKEEALDLLVQGAGLLEPSPPPPATDRILRAQAQVQVERGGRAWREKRWHEAARAFHRADELLPAGVEGNTWYTIRHWHALCLVQLDRRTQALTELTRLDEELRRRGIAYAPTVKVRARLLSFLGRQQEAVQLLEGWLRTFPDRAEGAELERLRRELATRGEGR